MGRPNAQVENQDKQSTRPVTRLRKREHDQGEDELALPNSASPASSKRSTKRRRQETTPVSLNDALSSFQTAHSSLHVAQSAYLDAGEALIKAAQQDDLEEQLRLAHDELSNLQNAKSQQARTFQAEIEVLRGQLKDSGKISLVQRFQVTENTIGPKWNQLAEMICQFSRRLDADGVGRCLAMCRDLIPNTGPILQKLPWAKRAVIESGIWRFLVQQLLSSESLKWASMLGDEFGMAVQKAQDATLLKHPEGRKTFNRWRAETAIMVEKSNDRNASIEGIVGKLLSRIYPHDPDPTTHCSIEEDLRGIVEAAYDLDMMRRMSQAEFTVKNHGADRKLSGFPFKEFRMVEEPNLRQSLGRTDLEKPGIVDLIIRPGLFKRGNSRGEDYHEEKCIAPVQVLCDILDRSDETNEPKHPTLAVEIPSKSQRKKAADDSKLAPSIQQPDQQQDSPVKAPTSEEGDATDDETSGDSSAVEQDGASIAALPAPSRLKNENLSSQETAQSSQVDLTIPTSGSSVADEAQVKIPGDRENIPSTDGRTANPSNDFSSREASDSSSATAHAHGSEGEEEEQRETPVSRAQISKTITPEQVNPEIRKIHPGPGDGEQPNFESQPGNEQRKFKDAQPGRETRAPTKQQTPEGQLGLGGTFQRTVRADGDITMASDKELREMAEAHIVEYSRNAEMEVVKLSQGGDSQ